MAQLLSDQEIRDVLGTIIKDGDPSSVRPNSYVRWERSGAPVGMLGGIHDEGRPEALLERLIQSGFPWNVLGTRLKTIDSQFQTVTNEYADIRESMENLRSSIEKLEEDARDTRKELAQVPDKVREILKDEQYRWAGGAVGILISLGGVALTITKSPLVAQWLEQHGGWIGPGVVVTALLVTWLLFWRR